MNGIIALGHFCEVHGPCVILCTQKCTSEPQDVPESLKVPWCESCQSVDLDQAFVSKDDKTCYVTTRNALCQELACFVKQAAVRCLSCEETSKDGGCVYFGDPERGHVLSHTFTLQDSLARGFQRTYCIFVFTRDKLHLLNSWHHFTSHMKQIAADLSKKASKINEAEQALRNQRSVRQNQGLPSNSERSLPQLTGEPAIFAQIHMWFTWLLSCEIIEEKTYNPPEVPVTLSSFAPLKSLYKEMDEGVFNTVCFCFITGTPVEIGGDNRDDVMNAFRQLLPTNFNLPKNGQVCKLGKIEGKWVIDWTGRLPPKLPKLLMLTREALGNDIFKDEALQPYLASIIVKWYNIAKALNWTTPEKSAELYPVLGVQTFDFPLLSYWTAQCRNADGEDK